MNLKLYHFTQDIKKILVEGLIIDATIKRITKEYSDAYEINQVLQRYSPKIDRSSCIFFFPTIKRYYRCSSSHQGIVIESEALEQAKLFVFDYRLAHRIWGDIGNASCSGISLEQSALEYWDSMQNIKDYLIHPKTPMEEVEILYLTPSARSPLPQIVATIREGMNCSVVV